MAILSFCGKKYTVDHAVKGVDYIHGYDAEGRMIASFEGVTDFSKFTYDGEFMLPEMCEADGCNEAILVRGALHTKDGRKVSAEQVGARPNNWMPSASDVGATPASHVTDKNNPHGVTAEQVGARPNTWTPSAIDVGGLPFVRANSNYANWDIVATTYGSFMGAMTVEGSWWWVIQIKQMSHETTLPQTVQIRIQYNNVTTANRKVEYRVCDANSTWTDWIEFYTSSRKPTAADIGAVAKVTSTDNAIVRFDGTDGAVQNYNAYIDDSGNLVLGGTTIKINGAMTRITNPNVIPAFINGDSKNGLGYVLCEDLPGVPTLLWTNANPTSSFNEQTISLDLSNYSKVLVYFRVYNGSGEYSAETFGVHGLVGDWCMATCNGETGSNPSQRAFQITTTGIKFSRAYYAKSIGGALEWSTNQLIPVKIHGIKGAN